MMLETVWPRGQVPGRGDKSGTLGQQGDSTGFTQRFRPIGLTMNDGRDVKEGAGKMAQRLKMLAAKPDSLVHSPGGGENQLQKVVLDLYRGTDRLMLETG